RGVVKSRAEHRVLERGADVDGQCMPAADDQRDVWVDAFGADPRGMKMRFDVMDPDEWFACCESERLRSLEADHQSVGQSRPLSRGDRIDAIERNVRFAKR